MSDSNDGLAKPLCNETAPRAAFPRWKALTLLSLLLGSGFALLFSSAGDHVATYDAATALATLPLRQRVVGAAAFPQTAFSQLRHRTAWQTSSRPLNLETYFSGQAMRPTLASWDQRPRVVSVGASADSLPFPPPHASRDLDQLLSDNADKLAAMSSIIEGSGDYFDEAWLLGFLLASPNDLAAAKAAASAAIKWSTGKGKDIFDAAKKGYDEASRGGGAAGTKWNNNPAFKNAPHLKKILPYIDGEGDQINHIKSPWGDICYILREAAVPDGIVQGVSVDELTEFFLYVRELNARWCYFNTNKTRSISQVITLHDLDGVTGSQSEKFRQAISGAYEQTEALHPLVTGPTVLLNMPLQMKMATMFKPLFPKSMQAKVRTEEGRLSGIIPLRAIKKRVMLPKTVFDDLEALKPSIKELSPR